jgi:hypothetical protein
MSRLGKTEWARSLGTNVYWAGMSDLMVLHGDAMYLIMDDFDFEFMPSKKQWWGAQKEFTTTDKYRKKHTIKWGKPLIYLCNEDNDPRRTRFWNQWFADNCIAIDIKHKLYY